MTALPGKVKSLQRSASPGGSRDQSISTTLAKGEPQTRVGSLGMRSIRRITNRLNSGTTFQTCSYWRTISS